MSTQFDFQRQQSAEGRGGPLQNQRSSSKKRPSKRPHRQSPMNTAELSDAGLVAPNSPQRHSKFLQEGITMSPTDREGNSGPIVDNARTVGRTSQLSSSAYSAPITGPPIQGDPQFSPLSPEDSPLPHNSQKRSTGLSLFPTKTNENPAPPPTAFIPTASTPTHNGSSVARSDSFSTNSALHVPTYLNYGTQSVEHLSLAAALEWKKAHKKSKKSARVPPVQGAHLLNELKHRDHV
jgi:hypothetical protein